MYFRLVLCRNDLISYNLNNGHFNWVNLDYYHRAHHKHQSATFNPLRHHLKQHRTAKWRKSDPASSRIPGFTFWRRMESFLWSLQIISQGDQRTSVSDAPPFQRTRPPWASDERPTTIHSPSRLIKHDNYEYKVPENQRSSHPRHSVVAPRTPPPSLPWSRMGTKFWFRCEFRWVSSLTNWWQASLLLRLGPDDQSRQGCVSVWNFIINSFLSL